MRTIFCSESYLYYITEGTVQIIRRYFMRLEKVQEALKTDVEVSTLCFEV